MPRLASRRLATASVAVVLALLPAAPTPAAPPAQAQPTPAAAEPPAPRPPAARPPAPPPTPEADGRVPGLWLPVAGPVLRGFEAPAGPYGPGHRGIDLGAEVGSPVTAPAAGGVTFAGPVAGRRWVSVLVAPGVVTTVGPLLDSSVATGERVRARAPLGRLAAGHGGAVHLSLRVDGSYVDPLPWLVDRPRPRLVPLPATA